MGFSITDSTSVTNWKTKLDFQLPSWSTDTTKLYTPLYRKNTFTPFIQSDDAFKLPGLSLERQYGTQDC